MVAVAKKYQPLQYVNLKLRSEICWACLEHMTGTVPNAYRYHAECVFKAQDKKEDNSGQRRKPR